MFNKPEPAVPTENDLVEIISKSRGNNKTILTQYKDTLIIRYGEYMASQQSLENVNVNEISDETKGVLLSKYSTLRSKNKPELDLKCPMCQIRHATAWDHFLPKEIYPDYSIFKPNLIWVCPPCNSKKGERNIIPERKVLNPYYDPLEDNFILNCLWFFDTDSLSIKFSIEEKADADQYIISIAKEHFNLFEVADLMIAEAANYIEPFCQEIREEHDHEENISNCAMMIIERRIADCRRNKYEQNHWINALWQGAILSADQIIQYLTVRD